MGTLGTGGASPTGGPVCDGVAAKSGTHRFCALEESVPRAPWGRRRTTDSPRPAGRRWAGRLRRSGFLARRVLLVRVGPPQRSRGTILLPATSDPLDGPGSRLIHAAELVAPISPAVPPVHPGPVPLPPGAPTPARRLRFALVQGGTVGSLLLGMLAIFLSLHDRPRWAP